MTRFCKTILFLAAATLPTATAGAAAISLTGASGTYTQNFDSLPASASTEWINDTTIDGWFAARTGSGNTVVAGDGGSNSGALYSFGAPDDPERALGSVGSGGAAAGHFAWGGYFVNDTNTTISQIDIGYFGEQWRNGGNATAQAIHFAYRLNDPLATGFDASSLPSGTASLPLTPAGWTAVPALHFTGPVATTTAAALNGNDVANRAAFSPTTLTGVTMAPGDVLWIRWDDPNHGGNDHGLSVDDFSLAWQTGAVALNDTVITPASSTVDFGRVVSGGTGTVLLNKTGVEATIFSTVGTGNFGSPGGAFVAGPVNNQAVEVGVGTTIGPQVGTLTVDNLASTSAAAGQGSDDPNDVIDLSVHVVANRFVNSGSPATPETNDFGQIIVGQSKTQDITLATTNAGDQSVDSLTSITIPAAVTVTKAESPAGTLKSDMTLAAGTDVLVNDGSIAITRSATLTATEAGVVTTNSFNYARFSSTPEGLPGETNDPHSRIYYQFTGLTSADASFDSNASEKSLTRNLGSFEQNTGSYNPSFSFDLTNLETTPDLTAGLDLIGFLAGLGDANIDISSLDNVDNLLATFSQLVNGTASIDTNGAGVGLLSRAFTLQLRDDENITGFQAQTLTLTLEANITPIPEPSGVALLALGLSGLSLFRRRYARPSHLRKD